MYIGVVFNLFIVAHISIITSSIVEPFGFFCYHPKSLSGLHKGFTGENELISI
jgi:hypothetical protein